MKLVLSKDFCELTTEEHILAVEEILYNRLLLSSSVWVTSLAMPAA